MYTSCMFDDDIEGDLVNERGGDYTERSWIASNRSIVLYADPTGANRVSSGLSIQ